MESRALSVTACDEPRALSVTACDEPRALSVTACDEPRALSVTACDEPRALSVMIYDGSTVLSVTVCDDSRECLSRPVMSHMSVCQSVEEGRSKFLPLNTSTLLSDCVSQKCKFWDISLLVSVEREFKFMISRKRRRIVEARSVEEISRAEYNELNEYNECAQE